MPTTGEELVSIITPLHNTGAFIAETIASVQAQSYPHWEMLIVDDCSTDNSVAQVEPFLSDKRIRLICLETNQGPAETRNTAIRAAAGRYIAFLDSDDLWLPDKLERQLAFMQKHELAFSFTAYYRMSEQGEQLNALGVPSQLQYHELLKTCYIGCLTAIYDCHKLGKVEMPPLLKSQDWGLWLTLIKLVPYAGGLNVPLACYRLRSNSNTANKWKASAYSWKIYRNVERLSLLRSCFYFCHYAVYGVLRQRFPRLARRLGVLHNSY